jgi:hypothetical protein
MLGLFDKETPRTAHLLFERAQEAQRRYGSMPLRELADRVRAAFPEGMHQASHDQVTVHYDDFPDFSFAFIYMLDEPTLTILAGGPFRGFMLQHASNRWHVAVDSPMGTPLGRKAKRLAEVFEQQLGVKNLRRIAAERVRTSRR